MTTATAGRVTDGGSTFPLEQLRESPTNPRKAFDQVKLGELASSIKANGVLQPLIARPSGKGFEIVDGARRFRAAKLAGLAEIPVVVRDMTDQQVLEAQVIANLQRADLHPLEEADGYHKLLRGGLDAVQISERVGRTPQYVRDRLKLLSLIKAAQDLFRAGTILPGHAVILSRLPPAEQVRALGDEEESPLFVDEQLLFHPDDESENDPRKAITPRELQAWVDKHVRFDTASDEVPFLFPSTAAAVQAATTEKGDSRRKTMVRITHETITPDEARDGEKVILGRSWKRADGERGSKTCERAVTGVIDIGPGRGEAFKVCIDKKGCAVHWGAEQREAQKRSKQVTKEGKTGEDRYAIEERKRQEQYAREQAAAKRFEKARPEILKAVGVAVRKGSAAATGALAALIVAHVEGHNSSSKGAAALGVPLGKTAEDLVRHAAFLVLMRMSGSYHAHEEFHKQAKPFGVDVKKILDQVAPMTPTAAPAKPVAPKSNPKPKSKAAKKSRGKKG